MILHPEASDSANEAKFKLQGFPEESSLLSDLERFYKNQPEAPRNFLVRNMFDELIFSGAVGLEGKVQMLKPIDRPRDSFSKPSP